MKRTKRIASFLCAVLLLAVLLPMAAPVEQAYAETEAELRQQLADIEQRKKDLEAQIKALQDDKNAALKAKLLLDQRNFALQEEIDTVTKQINYTEEMVAQYEVEEAEQYELFCKLVRYEEERGEVSYWSVLFKAISFEDLLSRIDGINEMMDNSQRVINNLRALRQQLTEGREELVAQKETLDARKKELASELAAANKLVNDFIATEKGLEAMHDEEDAAADRITEELKKYYEDNGGSTEGVEDPTTQSVLKGLIWPSKARYITSPFGPRNTGIAGASRNHKGVDIGAAYYTDIYAAQSGKVIQAGWNGTYGYSVQIAHDAGVATVYAHMWTTPFVKVGQYVEKGQVIGECGSTGVSSGPHIHYEVRVNGVQIDPLPYLPGYIRWW
ncbi:MAG: peptidase M23 [Ruminococcaceae bacterium]|nr:peptidase M23 [Oscillospiraceae bacterium]